MSYRKIIWFLKIRGIRFERGLDSKEVSNIENLYDINFPPDIKEFLMTALPVSDKFVNWRDISEENIKNIKERLDWPLEGMIFDIENNNFWYLGWGNKPNDLKEAVETCKSEMKKVPKLIPIYSHRYIPSEPQEAGNPIFSVYQTDIIYYGEELRSYLKLEFGRRKYEDMDFDSIKKIRFWTDLQE